MGAPLVGGMSGSGKAPEWWVDIGGDGGGALDDSDAELAASGDGLSLS